MKIDLRKISEKVGSSTEFDYKINASDIEIKGEYPFKELVFVSGFIVNRHGFLCVCADVSARYFTVCSRCLRDIMPQISTCICAVILKQGQVDEQKPDDYEVFVSDSDFFELDDIVIPSVISEVDMVYCCSDDCKGLCPSCGQDLNVSSCTCLFKEIDPRMQKLKEFLDG